MRYCVACMDKFWPYSTELTCWKCNPKRSVPATKKPDNLILSDGGRKAAGIKEDNDCTVRALAHACQVPYEEAHAWLAKRGRKNGRGVNFHLIMRLHGDKLPGGCQAEQALAIKRARGLRTFLERNARLKSGVWVLHSTQHASTLVDGKYFDSFDSTRKTFDGAWRIYRKEAR